MDSGYSYEVDNVDKNTWHNLLLEFDDISFYQTWSYGSLMWGEKFLSHLVLKWHNEVAAIAQIHIVKLPLIQAGIAYLNWGPMWIRKDRPRNLETLRNMIRALYKEYVGYRKFFLRIIPKQIHENGDSFLHLFIDEGFSWSPDTMQTVYLNLSQSLEEIKAGMRPKWRQTLNKSLKERLEIIEGPMEELSAEALMIVSEMRKRKHYVEFGSMEDVIGVNNDLPKYLQLRILVARYEGKAVAVLGWFPIGKTGIPLIGAIGDRGLKLNASYPLWWKMVEYYKNIGASWIDLAGINSKRNPGGYLFKSGIAGKARKETRYIGQFDASDSLLSSCFFKGGVFIREHYRAFLITANILKQRARLRGVNPRSNAAE